MATRRTFRCPMCGSIEEQLRSLLDTSVPVCQADGTMMEAYFGDRSGSDILINYGYRESRYLTEESANIARFQFTNL